MAHGSLLATLTKCVWARRKASASTSAFLLHRFSSAATGEPVNPPPTAHRGASALQFVVTAGTVVLAIYVANQLFGVQLPFLRSPGLGPGAHACGAAGGCVTWPQQTRDVAMRQRTICFGCLLHHLVMHTLCRGGKEKGPGGGGCCARTRRTP